MKTETKCRVAACAAGFALPRYADLPQMGLYLDQTVQYVNSYFRTFCGVELTSSMVSNYVKKGILSHPVHKKYARDQIASLMYIAVSKTVLSIENIDTLFKMQREHCSAGTAYDIFCEELETSLSVVFGGKAAQPETTLNDERLLLRIETGRKNQIRAQMQSIGHSIAGDYKYGAETDPTGRLMLHARRLFFIHPATGEEMRFETRIPDKFTSLAK